MSPRAGMMGRGPARGKEAPAAPTRWHKPAAAHAHRHNATAADTRRHNATAADGRRGTAAVELALIAPMLLILLAGIIDFGRVFHEEIELSSAVAAAAQYALINASSIESTDAASLAARLGSIVANSNGSAWAGAAVTVNNGATSAVANGTVTPGGSTGSANSCWCPGGSSNGWSWGTAAACGSACAGGTLAGKFVTISGTRAFTPIFGNYGLIGNRTLRQSTIVQAQ
jgi:Flp pilus assembly protein TadG